VDYCGHAMEDNNKLHGRAFAFRLSEDLFSFYEEKAKRERRKVAEVIRFALEDQRKAESGKAKRSRVA